MSNKNWQNLVFDADDCRAFSSSYRDMNSHEWKPTSSTVDNCVPQYTIEFFCINAVKDSRCDANVTKFRSILIEFDSIPPKDQYKLLQEKAIPFSMATFSAGKSIHFLIVLETPLETRAEYDQLVRRIHLAIPSADKACKNPSRLSRTPNAIRKSNAGFQELMYLGERIPFSELDAFLNSKGATVEAVTASEPIRKPRSKIDNIPFEEKFVFLNKATTNFLLFGVEYHRNTRLFAASCDAASNGFDIEEWAGIVITCDAVPGLTEKEIHDTVSNAFKRVMKCG